MAGQRQDTELQRLFRKYNWGTRVLKGAYSVVKLIVNERIGYNGDISVTTEIKSIYGMEYYARYRAVIAKLQLAATLIDEALTMKEALTEDLKDINEARRKQDGK